MILQDVISKVCLQLRVHENIKRTKTRKRGNQKTNAVQAEKEEFSRRNYPGEKKQVQIKDKTIDSPSRINKDLYLSKEERLDTVWRKEGGEQQTNSPNVFFL